MSNGRASGHQSRLVRPSNARTLVGRSTGHPPPIDSPVFASMMLPLLDLMVGASPRPGRGMTETINVGQTEGENRLLLPARGEVAARSADPVRGGSVHVLQADAQIIVAGDERQRRRRPQADDAD